MMDADSLSLLVILRQELEAIAKSLQPTSEIIEDIITDNGINIDGDGNENENENDPQNDVSINENENENENNDDHEEEEKAQELHFKPKIDRLDHNQIGNKIQDLIQNYLTPTIKQLNKKEKKKKKRSNNIHNDNTINTPKHDQSQLQFIHSANSSPLLLQSSSLNDNNNNSYLYSKSGLLSSSISSSISSTSSLLSEPGQVIDEMTDLSEKCGGCCRKFITSCFWLSIGIFLSFAF